MSLKSFRVMSFDVVGTLIDFERGMLDFLHRKVPGAKVTEEAFLDAYRQSESIVSEGSFYPNYLDKMWIAIAKLLGLPASQALAEGFRDSVADWPAFDDSVEVLKRLHRRYYLVAMTCSQRWALSHFERTLGHPFDDTVSSSEALCEKPDPQFFAFTRGRLSTRGFQMGDVLHVAQSQHHDIVPAHGLGYRVCWIERRQGKSGFGATTAVKQLVKPDYHLRTLAELADAVEASFGG